MSWFFYALLTAIFVSLKDILTKYKINKTLNEYLISWASLTFSLPFLYIFAHKNPFPYPRENFFKILIISGVLNLIATIFYLKALRYGDISLVIPLISLSPLILLISSPLILGEFPEPSGFIGVIFIVIGAYLLKLDNKKDGLFSPFKALIYDKGARYMLIVAIVWGISANLDKIGIKNSSLEWWPLFIFSFISLELSLLLLFYVKPEFKLIKKNIKLFLLFGFLTAMMIIFHMKALMLTLVSYVISIKRLSVLFSVLAGYILFKEKGIKNRILGSILMITGVIIITIFK